MTQSCQVNERFYEKVTKVKADVAAILNIFRTNQRTSWFRKLTDRVYSSIA